ncbi:hypothetical protein D3C72_2412400 [compost metagenome]
MHRNQAPQLGNVHFGKRQQASPEQADATEQILAFGTRPMVREGEEEDVTALVVQACEREDMGIQKRRG